MLLNNMNKSQIATQQIYGHFRKYKKKFTFTSQDMARLQETIYKNWSIWCRVIKLDG